MKHSLYRTLTILLLVLLPGLLLAGDQDPLATGKAALETGDIAGAIKSFKLAIKEKKKDAEGYIWLGTAYLKADSLDNANITLFQARELAPENYRVYELLGDLYIAQRVPAAGIDQYKKALDMVKGNDSVSASLWLKIGEASRKIRQYNEAAEAYISVLLIDSTNLVAHRELAVIYMRAKQYQKALPLYRDLVKVQPDSLQYKISYVKILQETGYKAELIPYAEEVVQKDPSQSETYDYLTQAYAVTGQLDQADSMYEKMNQDSLSAQDYLRWGRVKRLIKKDDGAIEKYEKAYGMDSTLTDIYYDLGTLYMKKKRYNEAVMMFDKKIAVDTTAGYQYASNLNAAMSLMQIKEYKRAKDYIENSIQSRPDNIKAYLTLAQCCGLMNDPVCQSQAYKKVIELATIADTSNGDKGKYNKELEEAYRMEGFRLLGDKKYSEAISFLNKALQYDPKNCTLLLLLGQSWHNNTTVAETKRWEDAKKYYCKVIQICPKSEEAKKAEVGLKLMGEECP